MAYWYIEENFLRARTDQGSWYNGFVPNAIGDGLFHGALRAMCTNDDELLMACIHLLNERKRWPDAFNDPQIAKNRLDKMLHPKKYRWQHGMTRDPFIAVIVAMDNMSCSWKEKIGKIKVPLLIQRPDFWCWHKYMSTGEIKYKKRYELWAFLSLKLFGWSYKVFSIHLHCLKAYAADSDIIKKMLHKYIHHWNLEQRLLTSYNIHNESFKRSVKEYIAKTGFQWTSEYWDSPGIWKDEGFWIDEETFIKGNMLPEDDEIKLDKDILEDIYNKIKNT